MQFFIEHPAFAIELHLDGSILESPYAMKFKRLITQEPGRAPDAILDVELSPGSSEGLLPIESEKIRIESAGEKRYLYEGPRISGELEHSGADGILRGRFGTILQLDHVLAILNIAISKILIDHGSLLVHSAAVDTPVGAICLMGRQGAGKSTAFRLLCEGFAGCSAINQDISILQADEGERPHVVKSLVDLDFQGPGDWTPRPLKMLCQIGGWGANSSKPLGDAEALNALMGNVLVWTPSGPDYQTALHAGECVVKELEVYELVFDRDEGFVEMMGRLAGR